MRQDIHVRLVVLLLLLPCLKYYDIWDNMSVRQLSLFQVSSRTSYCTSESKGTEN